MKSLAVTGNAVEVQTTAAEESFWAIVDKWLEDIAKSKNRKAKTLSVYRYNMKIFKAFLDEAGIAQPTRQTIKDWKSDMTEKGWSIATKNLYLSTVRAFYKWLEDEFGIDNIAAGIAGWTSTREHKRGFLSADDMKRLLSTVAPVVQEKIGKAKNKSQRDRITLQGVRDRAILSVLMCGALRTIEVSRLRVCDFIRDGGVYFLHVLGKGKDDREDVKISNKVAREIRNWLDAREDADIISDSAPLFCSLANSNFGDVLSSASVSRLCKDYLRAAKLKEKAVTTEDKKIVIKPVTAHSLRGSCATIAFNSGARLEQVKQQLRHQNIATTQIYLEEAEKFKNPVSDIVTDLIL